VCEEAATRGYQFDAAKIGRSRCPDRLPVARGQLDYEWTHLMKKLEARDARWHSRWTKVDRPQPHPLFRVSSGGVAAWEKAR
jgi:hypothetical protein